MERGNSNVTDSLTETSVGKQKNRGFAFAHWAFMAALMTPIFLLTLMMASHLGYVSFDLGFKFLTLQIGPAMAKVALAISCLSLLISLFMAPGRCGPWAFAAVLISGMTLGGFAAYHTALKRFPPIADVATNWERPLTFSDKLVADRGADAIAIEDLPRVPHNESLDWGGKTIPDINEATCPGARTIKGHAVTEDQVVAMLRANKYVVFGSAPWRVEATYQDNFYGFKTDIVIRLDPNGTDVRSVSRYNMPDMGSNCRRVTDIVNKIRAL